MVSIFELFMFENQGVFAILIGVLTFIIVFAIFSKFSGNRGISMIVAFVIGAISVWSLFTERFYLGERTLSILITVIVIAIVLKILWAFIRGSRNSYR